MQNSSRCYQVQQIFTFGTCKVIVVEGEGWINLAQGKNQWPVLVKTAMNLRILVLPENFLSRCTTMSFSRKSLHIVA